MAFDSDALLTEAQCANLAGRYLVGHGWQLASPPELAREVWHRVAGNATHSAVQTELARQYAATLHHCCLQTETAESERAWQEMKRWLEKNAPRLESHPTTQQEIVQETLIALQNALSQSPLQSPESFLIFALQTMRRRHIDWNRRQTAEKRDWRNAISLETLGDTTETQKESRDWEEYLTVSGANWRTIEDAISEQEVRRQLIQFVQEQLPTELQQQVFEAHFLDGLKPADVAEQLSKQPHEIRLVKARIVKKLKELPPTIAEQLWEILGRLDRDV